MESMKKYSQFKYILAISLHIYMNKNNIGKELRLLRNNNNLSLRDLSEIVDISFRRLSKYERGEEIPSDKSISKIEKGLNINFKELLEISELGDHLLSEFFEAIFYDVEGLDYFKSKIIKYKQRMKNTSNKINYINAKIYLMEYISLIINQELEKADEIEDMLLEYFQFDAFCNAILHNYIGLKYRFKQEYTKAIEYHEKALKLNSNEKINALIYYHSSVSYMACAKLMQAASCLNKAKLLFSKYASYHRENYCLAEYALVLNALERYDEAIEIYHRYILGIEQFGKEHILGLDYRNMCWIMICAKRYEEALTYLDDAVILEPKHHFTILYGIWCNYKLKRYKIAIKIINENKQLGEIDEYKDYYNLFSMLVKSEDKKVIIKSLDLAIKIVNDLLKNSEYDRTVFYIDIVLDLLEKQKKYEELSEFLEIKVKLLNNICHVPSQEVC